jgi:Glycosyl hydrolases family 39
MRDRQGTQLRPPKAAGLRRGAHGGGRTVAALVILALVTALVGSGSMPMVPGAPSRPAAPEGPGAGSAAVRHRPNPHAFAVGVTHTQHSIDPWGDVEAQARAKAVLAGTATYQNQHIFGWGALNPEPSPGEYDWSSLDRRMQLIRGTGGIPVITLCCAPDWMKGGRAGETDWQRLEKAPTPEHYGDFAELAATVARRYPDVRYFLVWNELKGFWNGAENRWNYEAYTRLYNKVYDALKAVDPTLHVGGPYVTLDVWHDQRAGGHPSALTGACGVVDQRALDVLDYWLEHKHGADFVAIDASSSTRDDGQVVPPATALQTFDALTRWVRQRTSLPVWWSEFHVGQGSPGEQRQLASEAVTALLRMAGAGAAVTLIWQPQRARGPDEPGPPALWTSTAQSGGGQPLEYAAAVAQMQRVLADLSSFEPVSWPRPDLGVLHGRHALLLVNSGKHDVTITVEGRQARLGPFEVRLVPMPEGAASVLRAARDGRYSALVRAGATGLSALLRTIRPQTSGADSCLRSRPAAPWMPSATGFRFR